MAKRTHLIRQQKGVIGITLAVVIMLLFIGWIVLRAHRLRQQQLMRSQAAALPHIPQTLKAPK